MVLFHDTAVSFSAAAGLPNTLLRLALMRRVMPAGVHGVAAMPPEALASGPGATCPAFNQINSGVSSYKLHSAKSLTNPLQTAPRNVSLA